MFNEIKAALSQLGNSKFLHLILEPVLIWGPIFALAFYFLSLWFLKDQKARNASLVILAISCFMVFPVNRARHAASPIASPSTNSMEKQTERRKGSEWIFYVSGGLALAAVFLGGANKGKPGLAFTVLAVAGGLAASATGVWLEWNEAKIYHLDLSKKPKSDNPARVSERPNTSKAPKE